MDDRTSGELTEWFAARHIAVESLHVPDERDMLLGDVTASAATHDVCHTLLAGLARRMRAHDTSPVRIRRTGLSDQETGAVRTLARKLADLGVVARTFRTDGTAVAVLPLSYCATNGTSFNEMARVLGGGWLEHYALTVARRVWSGATVPVANGVKVLLPTGARSELDVFALVDGRPVWVECKSGRNYHDQLAKFSTLARVLRTGRPGSILAVRRIDADRARCLGLVHGLTVTTASQLGSALASAAA